LISDDDLFSDDVACFERWKSGSPVAWSAQSLPTVTRVVGIAPSGAVRVRVRFAGGTVLTAAAVRTPTDPAGRFFGLVVEGRPAVEDVTALGAD
ncbi:hypothetical protein NQ272_26910, partial [Escherichia coli]|nr:hypothetical protein [Escherichia coli]